MSRQRTAIIATAIVLIAAGVGLQWWSRSRLHPGEVTPPDPPQQTASAPAARAAPPASGVRFPVAASSEPPLSGGAVEKALTELLGRKAVLSFVQTAEFPRRLVATVDNLGRAHAPSRLWPVNPAAGRFTTSDRDGSSVVATDNARRYAPLIGFFEGIDAPRATRLYRRLYPVLQQAYRDLGYPDGRFNDRLVEVIDQLLATPEAAEAMAVRLTAVKGPIASTQPWVRYEFADPALEALSAGQKMLLRVGPANQRRLKVLLAAYRHELVRLAAQR